MANDLTELNVVSAFPNGKRWEHLSYLYQPIKVDGSLIDAVDECRSNSIGNCGCVRQQKKTKRNFAKILFWFRPFGKEERHYV